MGHKPLRICHLSCRGRQVHSLVYDVLFDFFYEADEGISVSLPGMQRRSTEWGTL
jgi:hypothetical protein